MRKNDNSFQSESKALMLPLHFQMAPTSMKLMCFINHFNEWLSDIKIA